MAAGEKPAARMTLKPDGGGKESRITIASAWREANGKLGSFKLDKRVTQIAVQLEDGTIVRMKREGGRWTHYLDVFINEPERQQQSGGYGGERPAAGFAPVRPLAAGTWPAGDPNRPPLGGGEDGADDFGDDQIPFGPLRGGWR